MTRLSIDAATKPKAWPIVTAVTGIILVAVAAAVFLAMTVWWAISGIANLVMHHPATEPQGLSIGLWIWGLATALSVAAGSRRGRR